MLDLLSLICLAFYNADVTTAIPCYECREIPHLKDCSIVTQCNTYEECYVEQFVTTSGHVLFNSGCRDSQVCSKISGRSVETANIFNGSGGNLTDATGSNETIYAGSNAMSRTRRDDVSVCVQCCNTGYCNNQGCFDMVNYVFTASATPLDQRGPYCFSCLRQDRQESCRHVRECGLEEACLIEKSLVLGVQYYDTRCMKKIQCSAIKDEYPPAGKRELSGNQPTNSQSALRKAMTSRRQDSTRLKICMSCCYTDFCNTKCIENTL